MFLNINQLDFACLSAGVPHNCLPGRVKSVDVGDILPSQNPACPQFQPNEFSMAIAINIGVMLAGRKMSVTEFADRVGITMANISLLKNGKAKAIRLSTLDALCKALECQPGEILETK
jgi:putative transcriptional regulator